MSSEELLAACGECFAASLRDRYVTTGDAAIVIERDASVEVFRTLRDDPRFRFNLLVDITAVDFLGRTPRFEVVYHLYSIEHGHRLRVKLMVDERDAVVPSIVPIWRGADWLEREVWDMFGVRFDGHPDLRRILMYAEFKGHALRKDYPVDKRQPLVPERDPIDEPWRGH
jgi:NADH-quinone oxidoreductase subunit C